MKDKSRSVALGALLCAMSAPAPQEVAYVIEARLDETTNVLTGRAEVRYTNRQAEALDTLYFHLHLNAFRPNSAWAAHELQLDRRRFQELGPADHAFERVSAIRIDGKRVRPQFPFAPDSTVMAVPLPSPLRSDETITVRLDWTARLATVPRRQGRQGRHYDWAHGYPRIAVRDTSGWQINPLLPQGEFFGEFASYDVTLDVAADQIVGATGVPVSGDPGWERVNRGSEPPLLKRDAYAPRPPRPLGLLRGTAPPDRKRIRWRAEHVHHFAWTADPQFVYEGSTLGPVALHALFLPTDSLWPGSVIATMKRAMQFYDSIFGPYLYPQLTSSRRIDTGGTEFPMITMNAASPPIVHETGHQWAHAMLANNEFRDFWLDEGLVHYLGGMYAEAAGSAGSYERTVNEVASLDSAGVSEPIAQPAAQFSSFALFQTMSYVKTALVFRMLRWYLGDAAFRRGLRLYFEHNKLQHVDEQDLRKAMSEAAGENLDWFFEQWLHTTGRLDYAIEAAQARQLPGGNWLTRVDVTRAGDIWMPVDIRVGSVTQRLSQRETRFTVNIETAEQPAQVMLDPDVVLIDAARGNNALELTATH